MNLLCERQKMCKDMVEVKIKMQSKAAEKYYEQILCGDEGAGRKKVKKDFVASSEYGDIRTKEMKQKGRRDLEGRGG